MANRNEHWIDDLLDKGSNGCGSFETDELKKYLGENKNDIESLMKLAKKGYDTASKLVGEMRPAVFIGAAGRSVNGAMEYGFNIAGLQGGSECAENSMRSQIYRKETDKYNGINLIVVMGYPDNGFLRVTCGKCSQQMYRDEDPHDYLKPEEEGTQLIIVSVEPFKENIQDIRGIFKLKDVYSKPRA